VSKSVVHTHAGDDSDGKLWGIEGVNILFILAGLLLSVGLSLTGAAFRVDSAVPPAIRDAQSMTKRSLVLCVLVGLSASSCTVPESVPRPGRSVGLAYSGIRPAGHITARALAAPMAGARTRESWIALQGDESEWSGFLGAPIAEVDPQDDVHIRHGFYVIRYDTGERFPVWTAHVITRESAIRSEREAFARPGWKAEPALADLGERNLTDEDFVGLAAILEDGSRVKLYRGHMTGKDEMEGFGKDAMRETFFLSNVVAQSERNNSPFGLRWKSVR
jgi:hypothetical protein